MRKETRVIKSGAVNNAKNPAGSIILVVEDEELSREMLIRRLTSRGYQVFGVENGRACLEWIEKQGVPDLILLDVNMPELSGLEVIRIIRKDHSREALPVIMVSALTDLEDVINGLEAGANDYVVKPVILPVLLARMDSCLGLKESVERLVALE